MADGKSGITQGIQLERVVVYREQRAPLGPRVAMWATLIALGTCALVYFHTNVLAPLGGMRSQSDFSVYYRAAKDLLAGVSPYESPAYFYPPLVGFLMTPFALTDYVTARSTWFVLSHVMMLGAGWWLWRTGDRSRVMLCCIAFVWAFGGAFKETLDVGQLSPLLVVLLVAAYVGGRRLQEAGVALGFALKYIPGLLGVTLLLHRGWSAALKFAAKASLLVVIPWAVLSCFFRGPKAPISANYWMGTPSMFSWSLPSVVLRLLFPLHRRAPLPEEWEFGNVAANLHLPAEWRWISAGTAIVVLLAGTLLLAIRCRGKLTGAQAPWAMIALVSLSLAAAPVCWSHYQVLQYPGIALLMAFTLRRRDWARAAAVVLCFLLLHQLPQAALNHYHNVHNGWTTLSPATLYFWTSVTPLACLGLYALALAAMSSEGDSYARAV